MLTADLIKANQELANLTPQQIEAITTLSKNDEAQVIGKKVGEIHGDYDKDFEPIFGVKKPDGVKSYTFWKEQANAWKEKIDAQASFDETKKALTDKIASLEKQITDGSGDKALLEELKAERDKLTKTLESVRTEYTNKEKEWSEKYQKMESDNKAAEISGIFKSEVAALAIKEGYSKDAVAALLATAEKEALSNYDVTVREIGGKKTLEYAKDGVIVGDKTKGMAPITTADLVAGLPYISGLVDAGRKQTGAGTNVPNISSDGPLDEKSVLRIAVPKTKVEATEMIRAELAARGIPVGHKLYQPIMDNTWAAVIPSDLPLQ